VLLPGRFVLFAALYMANSLAYCLFLKYRVIVDVMSISIGFVFRLIAGCVAIGVVPSSWILLCGFSLALLLGFGKRRLEFTQFGSATEFRETLQSYSCEKLDVLLSVSSALCLLSYALYTTAPATIQVHRTENLIYTIPPVFYGVFRYIFKIQEGRHDGPVEVLMKDRVFLLNGLLWVAMSAVVLYS
jgi:4-hydroxybenzoate polyprenyltransferase